MFLAESYYVYIVCINGAQHSWFPRTELNFREFCAFRRFCDIALKRADLFAEAEGVSPCPGAGSSSGKVWTPPETPRSSGRSSRLPGANIREPGGGTLLFLPVNISSVPEVAAAELLCGAGDWGVGRTP